MTIASSSTQPDWHRGRLSIIFELLMTTKEYEQKGGANRIRLLYKSRLSSDLLKQYLHELVTNGLLAEDRTSSKNVVWKGKRVNRGRTYHITSKGIEFLLLYNRIQNDMPGVHI